MRSGNNRTYSGFVSSVEARLTLLDAILQRYSSKGYAVHELTKTEAMKSLVSGNSLQWMRTRNKEAATVAGDLESDLETAIRDQPRAIVLKPETEYLALPQSPYTLSHGNSMVVKCGVLAFSASNFVVGDQGIFVANADTALPMELNFFEFYNSLDKLKPANWVRLRA